VQTRTLASMPGLAGLYARAVGGAIPVVGRALGLAADGSGTPPALRVGGVTVDRDHLAAYRRLCGFGPGDRLPATYPQAVAFPLVLAVLTDPAFPFGAIGAVHIRNTIAYARPLTVLDRLDYEVAAGSPSPHPRGHSVVVELSGTADGERVWSAEMELLHREPASTAGAESESAEREGREPDLPADAPSGPARWRLPADLGRRYAAISGDRNPIHLADLAAKPFGFSRHIAHGMWTHARALAELDNRLPDAYSVEVAFKKPVTLPGTVVFGARELADRIDFGLTSRPKDPDGAPATHLHGRIRPR
jgi:acyl dehydratase